MIALSVWQLKEGARIGKYEHYNSIEEYSKPNTIGRKVNPQENQRQTS